jgi:hypothetical protein
MDAQVSDDGMEAEVSFEIIDGLDLGKQRRGARNGAAKYPIEKLGVGQSFFVPASDKVKDPLKTLGSAVSAAKMKFATQTGTETRTLAKRGEKNRLVLDDQGQRIMETRQVPVYEFARKYMLRGVSAGQVIGTWKAPSKGCLVQRVK